MTSHARPYDVIVVGLGGMGSAAAYHLARRGQRVLGLERFAPAHDQGSSHGGTRFIRQAYWEDPAYVPLAQRAYELWRAVEHDSGQTLLRMTGGLLLGSPDCQMVAGAQTAATDWGLAHEVLSAADIRRRFATLAPDDDTMGFFEPTAGVLHPELAVAAHLHLAAAAGAELHFTESVTDWWASRDHGMTVVTNAATYRARQLVICPGAWAPSLLQDVGVPFAAQRLVQTWFQPVDGITPFLPDRYPFWMWDVGSGAHRGFAGALFGFPALDGPDGGVKLSRVCEQPCLADTVDRVVRSEEVEEVVAFLRPRLAVRLGPVVKATVCMWTNTPDHHFVLGFHPRHREVIIAAGCSGHAFKFVPVIGEILADLAIDGKTAHSIALFQPGRGGSFTEMPAR